MTNRRKATRCRKTAGKTGRCSPSRTNFTTTFSSSRRSLLTPSSISKWTSRRRDLRITRWATDYFFDYYTHLLSLLINTISWVCAAEVSTTRCPRPREGLFFCRSRGLGSCWRKDICAASSSSELAFGPHLQCKYFWVEFFMTDRCRCWAFSSCWQWSQAWAYRISSKLNIPAPSLIYCNLSLFGPSKSRIETWEGTLRSLCGCEAA